MSGRTVVEETPVEETPAEKKQTVWLCITTCYAGLVRYEKGVKVKGGDFSKNPNFKKVQ